MDIKIDSLIPYDSLSTNAEHVFSIVEKNGKVILLKDNKPAYIILKYETAMIDSDALIQEGSNYTLHEAMRIVLREAQGQTMHAADLADTIYQRRLYLQKNGGKAQYNQIRARSGHYPELFEVLPGNRIKLKEGV